MKLTFVFMAIALSTALAIGLWLSFASPFVTEEQMAEFENEIGAVPATPADGPEPVSGRASLSSLLELNESLECEFRFSDENGSGEGTSFVANGQLRMDAQYQTSAGQDMVSSYIVTNDTAYVWTDMDGDTMAMMFPADDEMMDFESAAEDETGQFINPSEAVQYTCKPWSVDNSVFVPPSDIEFMDFSSMLEGAFDPAMMEGDFDPAMMPVSR